MNTKTMTRGLADRSQTAGLPEDCDGVDTSGFCRAS